MAAIGIDFGTSNCSAYVAAPDGGIIAIPLEGDVPLLPSVIFTARRETDNQQDYWDQTFLSLLQTGQSILFGTPALNTYMADPLGGILVKSPKSFLGSDLSGEYLESFEEIIGNMLAHIKHKAETHIQTEVTHAVIGRPINYHGTRGALGNRQALDVMVAAAEAAGFAETCFYMEPVAAALEYEKGVTRETRVLVIDIGGGTTDCAMVRVGPAQAQQVDRSADVLGAAGDRVGGTDFDQGLTWHECMPLFGKDGQTKTGRPIPFSLFVDAISTRSVPAQLRFRAARQEILMLIKEAEEPEKIARLLAVHEHQLQHRLIHSAEQAKISLSSQARYRAVLNYVELGLGFNVNLRNFAAANADSLKKIKGLVTETLRSAGCQPDTVFITGGMGMSPAVQASLREVLDPQVPIQQGDMLGSVGKGLGICAGQIFGGAF